MGNATGLEWISGISSWGSGMIVSSRGDPFTPEHHNSTIIQEHVYLCTRGASNKRPRRDQVVLAPAHKHMTPDSVADPRCTASIRIQGASGGRGGLVRVTSFPERLQGGLLAAHILKCLAKNLALPNSTPEQAYPSKQRSTLFLRVT